MSEITPATVITALDQAINDAHLHARDAGRKTEEATIEMMNHALKCGALLETRRKQVKHGEWQRMFATAEGKSNTDARFDFDYMTGWRMMKLFSARGNQPFTNFEECRPHLRTVGIAVYLLKEPEGHGEQESHPIDMTKFALNIAGFINSSFAKFDYQGALAEMPQHSKDLLRDQLAPAKQKLDELWERVA